MTIAVSNQIKSNLFETSCNTNKQTTVRKKRVNRTQIQDKPALTCDLYNRNKTRKQKQQDNSITEQ